MNTSTFALAAALLAAASLPGCATNKLQLQLQNETARTIGGSVSPLQIRISDISTGTICYVECATSWRAATPIGDYDCSDPDPALLDADPAKTVCVKRK